MSKSQIEKNEKRSQKSLWVTGLLTFFITPAGYFYTARYLLAVITLIIWLPLLILVDESDETGTTLFALLAVGTSIENVIAVSRSRDVYKKLVEKEQQQIQTHNLHIELLKLVQQKGQVTMADCVIGTGRDIEELRLLLLELERKDLIRSANRESDGAIIYRIV